MPLRLPIGIDDFRALRERGLAYVDKSRLICELLDMPGVQVVLLARPRRFGKTLGLSMLRYFFEKRDEDLSHLFEDLAVWGAGGAHRDHFQRYPVIHFSFKDTRLESFGDCWSAIQKRIESVFREHAYLLSSERLDEWQRRDFRAILDRTADNALYHRSLLDLSGYLRAHHGERVVILVDEYDEPIHAGHAHGYAPRILEKLRALLGSALKGNVDLFKAVVTGVLRVARESLFSGLNNLGVYSLLRSEFNTCFGFTEPEVAALLARNGRADRLDAVRGWYNGYLFGGEVIYNPWSVLGFLDSDDARLRPYWLSTSSNDLVRELLERHALRLQSIFETLLEGGSIDRVLDENVVLSELHESEDTLWSLLVFAGYLKARQLPDDAMERAVHQLSIPNREVREVYATTFQRWMKARLHGHGGDLDRLTLALLEGDAEGLEEQLQAFVTNLLSYQDPGTVDPERVYQGFVIGLLAVLEPEYLVRSNRESGAGRPDVTIRPRTAGKPAVVLELKVARRGKKTPAAALREGLAQIRGRGYEAELVAAGASVVRAFAVAFDGKRVWVKAGGAAAPKAAATRAKVAKRRGAKVSPHRKRTR